MGLRHPQDLEQWRRWQRPSAARRAVAAVRRKGAPEQRPQLRVLATGQRPRFLVALDSANPSSRASVLEPAQLLERGSVACVGSALTLEQAGLSEHAEQLPGWDPQDPLWAGIERVLSVGAGLPAGDAVCDWAVQRGIESVVVQHGLLTPWAPPLPAGATLLSFTEQDGAFWASGRSDVTVRPVGSQALWSAAAGAPAESAEHGELVFLGQMHGRELPRRQIVGQTLGFLSREPQTVYRPHPSEKDILSRAVHAGMRRRGVRFQDASVPLASAEADVVSVFSTGVLEAAQRGRRAWVHHDDPPPWLVEFWDRYGLARWGQEPTRPVRWAETEPARAVADYLRGGTP